MHKVGTKVIVKEYFTEHEGIITKEAVNGFYTVESNGHQHEINENDIKIKGVK